MLSFIKTMVFLLIAGHTYAQAPAANIPAFTFFRVNNTAYTTDNLPPSKKLFFIFFDAGCEHCQRTVGFYNQHTNALKKAAVFLVTLDKPEKANIFMDTYGANLRKMDNVLLLQDKQFQFIPLFKPKKYPSMFLYSAQRKLLFYSDDDKAAGKFLALIEKPVKN